MFAPSTASSAVLAPTLKVPSIAPSLARSLLTLLVYQVVTQMFAPSKATLLLQPGSTVNCIPVWFVGYQRKRATCKGLYGSPWGPCGPGTPWIPFEPVGPAGPAGPGTVLAAPGSPFNPIGPGTPISP